MDGNQACGRAIEDALDNEGYSGDTFKLCWPNSKESMQHKQKQKKTGKAEDRTEGKSKKWCNVW